MSSSNNHVAQCAYCKEPGTRYGYYNFLWRYSCEEHDYNNPKHKQTKVDFVKCVAAQIIYDPRLQLFSCANCKAHWQNHKLKVCPNSAPLANAGLDANVPLSRMTFDYDLQQQKLKKNEMQLQKS